MSTFNTISIQSELQHLSLREKSFLASQIHLNLQQFEFSKPFPISSILADPTAFFNNLGKSHKKVLNFLARLSSNNKRVYPTYDTISREGKKRPQLLSIQHVKRIINDLVKWGLIAKCNRGVKVSNLYKLSEFFNNDAVKQALSSIQGMTFFKTFRWLSKKLVVSARILLSPLIKKSRQYEYEPQQLRDKISLEKYKTIRDTLTISKIHKLPKIVLNNSKSKIGSTTHAPVYTCDEAIVSVPEIVQSGFLQKKSAKESNSMSIRPDVLQLGLIVGATDAGMCELMCFDEITISAMVGFADSGAGYKKVVDFGKQMYAQQGRKPDWRAKYTTAEQLGTSPDSPKYMIDRTTRTDSKPKRAEQPAKDLTKNDYESAAVQYRNAELQVVAQLLSFQDSTTLNYRGDIVHLKAINLRASLIQFLQMMGNIYEPKARQELEAQGRAFDEFKKEVQNELEELVGQHPEISYLFKFSSKPEKTVVKENNRISVNPVISDFRSIGALIASEIISAKTALQEASIDAPDVCIQTLDIRNDDLVSIIKETTQDTPSTSTKSTLHSVNNIPELNNQFSLEGNPQDSTAANLSSLDSSNLNHNDPGQWEELG